MVLVIFDVAGIWRIDVRIRKRLSWNDLYERITRVTGITLNHMRRVEINGVAHRIEIVVEQDWDEGPVYHQWPEDPEGDEMMTLRDGDVISIQELENFNLHSVIARDNVRILDQWITSGALYFAPNGDELFYAKSPAMVREMVHLGANIHQSRWDFANVLFFQVSRHRSLEEQGGDVTTRRTYPRKSPEMIRTFVELGADLYATQDGRTLLESAVEFRDVIEELMLRDGRLQ